MRCHWIPDCQRCQDDAFAQKPSSSPACNRLIFLGWNARHQAARKQTFLGRVACRNDGERPKQVAVRDPSRAQEIVKRRLRIEGVPIYLIGVNHEAQASTDGTPQSDIQKKYVEVLKEVIREVGAECVAEE